MARGRRKTRLRKTASAHRRRMIGRNRWHPADLLKKRSSRTERSGLKRRMPSKYRQQIERVEKSAGGRKALARYRKFWGIPYPTAISTVTLPGKGSTTLVGMGVSPKVLVANGPDAKTATKVRTFKGKRIVATNTSGDRIIILNGRGSRKATKRKLRFIGWAPETHYLPTKGMESAGTFKKGKYWVHQHDDDGGRWPKVYRDQAGNFVYAPGTYKVTDWIRR